MVNFRIMEDNLTCIVGMLWIALELNDLKTGCLTSILLPVQKLTAFEFGGFAKCGNADLYNVRRSNERSIRGKKLRQKMRTFGKPSELSENLGSVHITAGSPFVS